MAKKLVIPDPHLAPDVHCDLGDWVAKLKSLKSSDRVEAVRESWKFGDKAISYLINALGDKSKNVGEWAAYTLSELGEVALPDLLTAFCTSRNKQTRQWASWCLIELGSRAEPATTRLLEKLPSTVGDDRDNTMIVLKHIGKPLPEAVPCMLDFLKEEPNPARRLILIIALSALGRGSDEAIDLMKKLASSDPDECVREESKQILMAWKQEPPLSME